MTQTRNLLMRNWNLPELSESDLTSLVDQNNSDRTIKQLLNSVIPKYRDFSMSRRSITCLRLWLGQITDPLATDKARYFTQPRSIIVNLFTCDHVTRGCLKIRAKFEGKQISVSRNALSGFSIFSNCKTLQEEASSHLKIHLKFLYIAVTFHWRRECEKRQKISVL